MQRLWPTAALITAAIAGSAVFLAGLITVSHNLMTYSHQPAAFLPIQQTVALVHRAHLASDSQLNGFTIPPTEAVALMAVNDQIETVTFQKHTKNNEELPTRGIYHITGSDTALQQLNPEDTIAKESEYQQLQASYGVNDHWVLLKTTAWPVTSYRISPLLALITSDAAWLGLRHIDQSLEYRRVTTEAAQQSAPLHLPAFEQPDLVITSYNLAAEWHRVAQRIPADHHNILFGQLQQTVFDVTSHDVSLNHDILPLLAGPSSLQMKETASGTVVLVSGALDNRKLLSSKLDHLHHSYQATLPASRTTVRQLDNRFSAVDIRYDDTTVMDEQKRIGPWNVRQTGLREADNGLFSAVHGNRFLLSNHHLTLRKALDSQWTLTVPFPGDTVTTAGLWHIREPLTLPIPNRTLLGQVQWQLTERGRLANLTISPKPPQSP